MRAPPDHPPMTRGPEATGPTGSSTVDGLPSLLADDLDRGFESLVRATQHELFSGILRMVGRRDRADDLTQDTLVRAYRALVDFPPERRRALRLRAWLWTIARNVVRSDARRRSRRPQLADGPPPDLPDTGPDTDPSRRLGELESDRVWARRLDALSDAHRDAVVLRHVVGLSYEEIAAIVDRPVPTTRSHVHRGLQALRAILEQEVPT